MNKLRWTLWPLILLWLVGQPLVWADDFHADWKTGSEFEETLELPISVTLQGNGLRATIRHLAQLREVAMLLDRRVDPGQPVEIRALEVQLWEFAQDLAEQHQIGVCQVEEVLYFGPKSICQRLATLVAVKEEELRQQGSTTRQLWSRKTSWKWGDLAEPRELLAQLAKQNDVRIANPAAIPHDLWAGVSLPPLALHTRLQLILAQYDLTFEYSGSEVRLIPIPENLVLERRYTGGSRAAQRKQRWEELAPEAEIQLAGRQIVVRGRWEDHQQIEADLKPKSRGPRSTEKRYTLTVENKPLDAILQAICAQAGYELDFPRQAISQAGIRPDQLISFSVKQQSFAGLIRATLASSQLGFRLQGKTLTIFVKP